MKNFTDLCSPVSWMVVFLVVYCGVLVVFTPSINELFLFMMVDTILIVPATLLEQMYFLKKYPQFKSFFPKPDFEKLKNLDLSQVKTLFLSLYDFPKKRAQYIFFGNILKIIPSGLIITFFWHSGGSSAEKFIKFLFLELFVFTFLYSIEFVEFYALVNKTIAKIHSSLNTQKLFEFHNNESLDLSFLKAESISLLLLPVWAILLITSVVFLDISSDVSKNILALKMLCLGSAFVGVGGRIFYLYRNYFQNGLINILEKFRDLGSGNDVVFLSLHSDPILANVEKTFNNLSLRLFLGKKELSESIGIQIEQSRFQALGEMAGLIAHDLSGPIQIISFCTESLTETTHNETSNNRSDLLLSKLRVNVDRCLDLISSLKAYVRNPDQQTNHTDFIEAHKYVCMLLNTQFRTQNFEKNVAFEIHPALSTVLLPISRPDLVHVLYNLYKNSIQNFFTHKINPGLIRVYPQDEKFLTLAIEDNGTGISAQKFEDITGYKRPAGSDNRSGLGLRLTRRLVERCGDLLQVIDKENGSLFLLKLSGESLVKNSFPLDNIKQKNEEVAYV